MEKTYTFNEIKESKLIYDRKPPAFGIIMTALTLAFLMAAFIWAGVSTKTYVVRASGLATDENKINVMNTVTGKINDICVTEGQHVSEGDLLMEIDDIQMQLQISQLQATVDLYQKSTENTQTLIDFVNEYSLDDEKTQSNPFDKSVPETALCYANAETFLNYVQQSKDGATEENPFTQKTLDDMKSQVLIQLSVYSSLEQYITQKNEKQSQLDMYKASLSEYKIYAEQDGIVHLTAGITTGTMLSQGVVLATISSGQNENLFFDVAVSATERSKLQVDSDVEIAVSGMAQTEFGTLLGKVKQIDNDCTQTEDGQVYYRVKIKPSKTEMTDKFNHTVELTTGMIGECRIKYDETTWLRWAWEQIVGKLE